MERKLTLKQELFCREYIVDLNGRQAAIRAGYSEKTAQEQASRLLSLVKVQGRISELLEARGKRIDSNADDVLKHLMRSLEYAGAEVETEHGKGLANYAAYNKAIELAMRHHGMLVDRKEITGKNGGAIELSDTERAAKIKALLEAAESRLND